MLEDALAYAQRGWAIFPVRPELKTPATPNGFKDATTDPEQIRAWWAELPTYNIGIATGKQSFTAIDPDGPHAPALFKKHGVSPPRTTVVKTPNGHHIYVAYDERFKQTARLLEAGDECDCDKKCGVDVRNDGGYVVAPPSIVNGNPYKWISDDGLEPWEEGTTLKRAGSRGASPKEDWQDKPSWVADLLVHGAGEGQRNDAAARLAGYFRSINVPIDIALASMKQFADACKPPMDYGELEAVVRSAWRYQPSKPNYTGKVDPAPNVDITVANKARLMWPEQGIFISCDRIKERSDGLTAWMTITQSDLGEIYGPVQVNVLQPTFDQRLPKQLMDVHPANWASILQHVRSELVKALNAQGESIDMGTYKPQSPSPWAMFPLLRKRQPNLVFGDGGNGKTTLGVATAISVVLNQSLLPAFDVREPGPCLYLDWETDEDEFASVRDALLKGHNLEHRLPELQQVLRYRRMTGPIETAADALAREIGEYGITTIVVDSLIKAIGDNPNDANTARVFFQTLSMFDTSALIFTHISNDSVRQTGSNIRPYGSVFWWDYCRNNWFIKRTTEEEPMKVGLFHSKLNRGKLLKPFGFEMTFEEQEEVTTSIRYRNADLLNTDLAVGAQKIDRVVHLLTQFSGGLAPAAIAEELEDSPEKIRALLNRYKDKRVVQIEAGRWGALSPRVTGYITGEVTTPPPIRGGGNVVMQKENRRLPYKEQDDDLDFS